MERESREVTFTLNGQRQTVSVPTDEALLKTLRREFNLMSVRSTCNIGICGACTVLVDDQPISACLTLTARCENRTVVTAEGLLSTDGSPGRVQSSFIEHSAFQCSFCTPGFVVTIDKLLRDNPDPSDEEIREYLAGNLCRCGSYQNILEAVQSLRTTSSEQHALEGDSSNG